jgi:hypothetical protein
MTNSNPRKQSRQAKQFSNKKLWLECESAEKAVEGVGNNKSLVK